VATIVPTDRPVHALAAVLMPFLEPDMSEVTRLRETNQLAADLLSRKTALRDIVDRVLAKQPGTDRLLLIADQWEELFTLCKEEAARRCFIDNILEATEATKLSTALTLRGDFFGRAITDYRPLSDRVQGAQVNLGPMKRDELRLAIEEPAKKVGLTFEAGLVDLILEQVGNEPGHLPLVEFVLRRLWEDRQGGQLHHAAYKAMGELQGAIAQKAESLFAKLSDEDQRKVQQIFLRLVRPGEGEADTRRRATLGEVGAEEHRLARTLADERLVVTSQLAGSGEETIEVSHEALIRHWDRLKGWVDADRRFLAWQQRLRILVEQYEEHHKSADVLLRGFPLTEALEWLKRKPDSFSAHERQFVTASKTRVMRRRWLTAAIGGLLLVVVGGPLAWLEREGATVKFATSVVMARLHLVSVAEPEMVPIFSQQGDTSGRESQDEQSVRQVTIKPFAMGKFEVTFQEYERYVELTGGRLPSDESWGREKRPVINVSWDDAVAYAKWLSRSTGKGYRLPTEAEWEYAARSGGKDEIWAGTSNEEQLKDYAVYNAERTEPVGSKKPNGLGLYDMSGNVWEWVQDCYEKVEEDKCGERVVRGGSWGANPLNLRASSRLRILADFRFDIIGFRLAQDIDE
jgi:formylglycine-generating enzyme required for sulfatase activity